MNIFKLEHGWYEVLSETEKGKSYYCYPFEYYCSCPSVRPCKHMKEIHNMIENKTPFLIKK